MSIMPRRIGAETSATRAQLLDAAEVLMREEGYSSVSTRRISFAKGRSRESLTADRMLLRSLERALEIVGEAAGKVSPEFQSAHPEIPWGDMIGMRNRLIHAYFDINPLIVWSTILSDLPALIAPRQGI